MLIGESRKYQNKTFLSSREKFKLGFKGWAFLD